MSEHKEPIPSMIYNAAVGGHVTNSQQIIDENENKEQSQINSEVKKALGSGGNVDSRISEAKEAAIFTAATDATNKVTVEKTRAEGAERALNSRVDTLENAVGTGGSVDSRISAAVAIETTRAQAAEADRYTKSETYTKEELHNLITTPNQKYVSVTAIAQTTAVTDVLPATGAADTTYRVGNWDGTQYNDSVFSEYAWNGNAYIKLSTKSQIGEVYDISANHVDTKYANLAAALGTNGANIPQNFRKGGMSVKFVQSSDNKYVQYRLMSNSFNTTVANWQGVDDEPTVGSKNFVESGGTKLNILEATGVTDNLKTGFYNPNIVANEYIRRQDGKFVPSKDWSRTGLLSCKDIDRIFIHIELPTEYCAYYDEKGEFIETFSLTSTSTYTAYNVPSGAAFFAVSGETKYMNKFKAYFEPNGINDRINKSLYNHYHIIDDTPHEIIGGYYTYAYNFIGGHTYRIDNNSKIKRAYSLNLTSNGTATDIIGMLSTGCGTMFTPTQDADAISVYFENEDGSSTASGIDLLITEGSISMLAKVCEDLGTKKINLKRTQIGYQSINCNILEGTDLLIWNKSKVSSLGSVKLMLGNTEIQQFGTIHVGGYNYVKTVSIADANNISFYCNTVGDVDIEIFIGRVNSDLAEMQAFVAKNDASKYYGDESIRALNRDKEQYIKAAAKFDRRHQSVEEYNIPLIMVTTDVHNRFDQLKRAMDYSEETKEVACTLCLGDFVRNWNDLTQEVANELFTTYSKPIFRIIGNHELLYNNVLDPERSPSLSDLMNLFYTSTMNQHNGDIHPEGKPWWYYDVSYPTSDFKLRFIGLCQYEDTSVYNYASYSLEQLTWLCNTLERTDSNTYIVLLQHTVNATMRREDIYNEDFTIADYLWFSDGFPGTEIVNQIVDAWMYGKNLSYTSEQTGVTIEHTFNGNNAERFVCYLCGHEHVDGVYTHPVFKKQICITLDCTSGDWWQSWNDTHQITEITARDSVTLFAFDPYTRMIKLIRLGANVTNDMKKRVATCIKLPKIS